MTVISGAEAIKVFQSFGFEIARQKGSHIVIVRMVNDQKQVLTIPNHSELDRGTLRAIIRQASAYIPETDLFEKFGR